MGFAGLTGSSTKALADLSHYGLIEKAGKGAIRVAQRAVDILYPASPTEKASALNDAAFSPALFGILRTQFQDGVPSENNLRSYLMRTGFATSAIPYVLNSYRETCRLAQEAGATEGHGDASQQVPDSSPIRLDYGESRGDGPASRSEDANCIPRQRFRKLVKHKAVPERGE